MRKKAILFSFCLSWLSIMFAQQPAKTPVHTVKIVTWNIQMLPNSLALFSKALRKKQCLRAKWIIAFCLEQDYDVIVFQEVFDVNIKHKLKRQFASKYPHQVDPLKRRGSLSSNGILILSRLPMTYQDHIIYQKGVHADRLASKGCTLVEVEKEGKRFQIAGTHLQAEDSEAAGLQREKQFYDIRKLVDRNRLDSIPVFVIGDMNTPKANVPAYSLMLEAIGVQDFPLNDKAPYTIDADNYWNTHEEPMQLDYVLLNARKTNSRILHQQILRPKHSYKGVQIDLADHYGIVAEIEISLQR